MSQTAYSIDTPVAIPGMVADAGMDKKIVTGSAQVAIAFGLYVCHNAGGGDSEITLPAAAGDVTNLGRGFAIADTSREYDATGYVVDSAVPVMEEGTLWVSVEDAVDVEGPVFIRTAAGTLGSARSDADGGDATVLPGAKFASSTTAAGLAKVTFNKRS